MKKIFYFLLVLPFLSSCLSIKSEYPSINYYIFSNAPSSIQQIDTLDGSLQVKVFSIASHLESDMLISRINTSQIKRYYYHRWQTQIEEMMTDVFFKNMSIHTPFKRGISKSFSRIVPDFILETQILDLMAYSHKDIADSNFVDLEVKFTLIKRSHLSTKEEIVQKKIYTSRIQRLSDRPASIPLAFSKALAAVSDNFMIDIRSSLK